MQSEKKNGGVTDRESDATSKETVSDLDDKEKVPGSSGEDRSVPDPDGEVLDGEGGRADGSDTGGPM
ncbi:MAG: hypothetical protein QOE77_854 [Blastocatellia bacterium]|jgi:hypothetical protein|nr:hypothetical protein [Blastocatellia bacterium]